MTRNNGIISYLNDLDRQLGALQRLDRPASAGITTTYSGTPTAGRLAQWTGPGTIEQTSYAGSAVARYSGVPTAGAVAYWTGNGTVAHASFGTADVALLSGRGGGQIFKGGTASGEDLTLMSTNHATKGQIFFGSSVYNEVNNRLGINTTSPLFAIHVDEGTFYVTSTANDIGVYMTALDGAYGLFQAVNEANNSARNLVLQGYGGVLAVGLTSVGASVLGVKAGTSTNDAAVGGVLYADSAQNANVSSTETDLASYSVPANTLAVNNQSLEFHAWGTTATAAGAKIIKVYFGSDSWTVITTGAGGAPESWSIKGRIVRTGAATQKVIIEASTTVTTITSPVVSTASRTLSSANTLKITGDGAASNEILQQGMMVIFHDANT